MSMTKPTIEVDGVPLEMLTTYGDMVITDRWPGGCWELSFAIPVSGVRRYQQLAIKKPVVVKMGSTVRWSGFLTEPDWDDGLMVAQGWVRQGEEALARTGTTLISTPDVAIDQAISRGPSVLNWTRPASLSNTPLVVGDETDSPNYLTALLDAWALQAGRRWGVNTRREVYSATDPTTPTFTVTPDSGSLGVSDATLAASVLVVYQNAGGGTSFVTAGSGGPEVAFSIVEQGVRSGSDAQTIANGILARTQARVGWTNGLELTADQIGAPVSRANLATVSAGAFGPVAMRLLGLRDVRGVSASTDIVLSETTWNVADETVQCLPVGMVSRDLSGIAEDVAGEGVETL